MCDIDADLNSIFMEDVDIYGGVGGSSLGGRLRGMMELGMVMLGVFGDRGVYRERRV